MTSSFRLVWPVWQFSFPQVCGSPDIPLHLLKSVATYKGVEPTSPLIQWFWKVMESFSNTERSLFLRFVWGRTRLPRTIADFRGRDFVVQVKHRNLTLIISIYVHFFCFHMCVLAWVCCDGIMRHLIWLLGLQQSSLFLSVEYNAWLSGSDVCDVLWSECRHLCQFTLLSGFGAFSPYMVC